MRTLLLGGASALVVAGTAVAQTAPPPAQSGVAPAAPESTEIESVVVTGSRIARAGFEAPTPVTVASSEQLISATPTTIGDALRQLPALNASVGPRGAQTSGGQGGAFLNLRNLGAIRTLTLLDGRRFVPQSGTGTVDTNLFPQALVSRVEVVTGGASAAYGSDAVAGVVNFILDKTYTGFKMEAGGGISDRNDGAEQRFSAAFGRPFSEGRGHFIASAEYFRAQEIPERLSREVAQRSCQIISLPSGSPTRRGYACGVRVSNANFNGLVTGPTALAGTTFDAAGNPIPFNYGTLRTGATMLGGDGVIPQFAPLSAGIERGLVFSRASYDVTPSVKAYLELLYGQIDIGYQVGSFSNVLGNTALTIRQDNAFLPTALRERMVAANAQTLTLGKYLAELPKSQVSTLDNTYRAVGGLEGQWSNWNYSAYFEFARNRRKLNIGNDLILPNYYRATDAVRGANGQIVCRTTADADPGCVPVNPFGAPNLTADQRNYIVGTNYNRIRSYEYTGAFEISGEPFSTWAGPVGVAFGGEIRRLGFDQIVDARSTAPNFVTRGEGVYRVGNARPQEGEYDIKEAFGEVIVPLAEDTSWARSLELNAAARVTDYSTSGTAVTWKVGGTYEPMDGLRFRATRSRDIRAPTLNELFQAGVTNFIPSAFDTPRGVQITNARSIQLGNLNLEMEKADTLTVGVVYSPSFIPRFDVSLDYYKINIDDAISTPGNQDILDDCARGVQAQCSLLVRAPPPAGAPAGTLGELLTVYIVPLNLQTFRTEGLDIEMSYRVPLEDVAPAIGGALTLRAMLNYTSLYETQLQSGAPQNRAGETGTAPRWRGVFQANYDRGPLGLFLQARYTSDGWYDKYTLASDLPQIKIKGQTVWNGRVSYTLPVAGGDWQAYVNVQNIFDKAPPVLAPTAGSFDPVGRFYRFGLRLTY